MLTLLFQVPYLQWLPRGIHEWAQADRLSLAYGFYDNGFNFLLPRSFSLHPINGIVGVEFPIQSYLAALLGLVVGRDNINLMFRLLDVTMMAVGCSYLFKLVFETTRHIGAALLPGAFLMSAPIFAYYSGNYLPDPFGVSVLFVSFYYLHRFYYRSQKFSDFSLALAFATLATLIKLAIVIYLGSICAVVFVVSYLQPTLFTLRQKLQFVLLLLVSFSLVGGWIYYMRWLNEEYASWIFMATVKPLRDKSESDWVLSLIERYIQNDFFTYTAHKVLKGSMILLGVVALWRWRQVPRFAPYAALVVLAACVVVPYYILMGPQFAVHDYYLIVPVLPLVVLLVLGGALSIPQLLGNRWWGQVLSLLVVGALLVNGYQQYRRRMQETITGTYRYHWMTGGAQWLKQVGLPSTARLLVLGEEEAPNLSLTYFQRPGIVVADSVKALNPTTSLQLMTGRGLQYVVVRANRFKQIQELNPQYLEPFKTLSVDKKYVLLAPRKPLQGW